MTMPREVIPGSSYLITRRCSRREFRLLPSRAVNQIIHYCLAYAAHCTGTWVHAVQTMSNHWHLVVTDPEGNLPKFMEIVHKLIAKCLNAKFEWEENLWSCEKASAVRLEDEGSILSKIVYVLINPVAAGLVAFVRDWLGFHTADTRFGTSLKVKRPKVFFRANGDMPDELSLELVRPDAFSWMDDAAFTARVRDEVARQETAIQDAFRAQGRTFLGTKRCLKLSRSSRPRTKEPMFEPSPTVAANDTAIRKAAVARQRAFVKAYREAYELWKAGDRDVLFPPGTYWLRVHAGVLCRAPT